MSNIRAGLAALILAGAMAGCDAPVVPNALVGSVPPATASASIEPTEVPETPESTAKSAPKLAVSITKAPDVKRGSNMTITAKTKVAAICSISVTLPSGDLSGSKGLKSDKKANSKGLVSWTWRTGSNTGRGKATAEVSCELGGASGGAAKVFSIK